jgi:hypothetical protein
VDPLRGGAADRLLHHVDERRRLVIGHRFALTDGFDREGRALPDCGGVFGGNHSQFGPGLAGEDLDFEPVGEARLVGEKTRDLR